MHMWQIINMSCDIRKENISLHVTQLSQVSVSLSLSPLLTFLVLQMKPKNWHVPGMHTNTALNPIPWLLCFCSIRYLYLRVPWALQGLTHPKLSPFRPLICNALNFPPPLNFAAQKVSSVLPSRSALQYQPITETCYLHPRILFTALLRGCQARHFAPHISGPSVQWHIRNRWFPGTLSALTIWANKPRTVL